MVNYPHLFSPFKLGSLSLKNRVVATAHATAKMIDGIPTDEDLAYWEKLARGGAGLLITGGTVVHPSSILRRRMLSEAYLEETVPKYRQRAEVIHAHGAKVIGQILHLGREMIGGESDHPLRAPSSIKSPRAQYRPVELTHEDIAEIIDAFAISASNLNKAGYDGVEIHAAHGYLVAQFLSPATNYRTDKYGGSLKGRMKFLLEIIEAIRQSTNPEFVLGIRLSADEEISDGLHLSDTLEIVNKLGELSHVDYLNITLGIRGAYVKDLTTPQGIAVEAAGAIRISTNIPVLVSQRIKSPMMAEEIVAGGYADLVGSARAFIADPEWPNKAKIGRSAEIIPCIGCNQECRTFDPYLYCTVNPVTGREGELGKDIQLSHPSKRIAIVGGGPAGLEAARVAALRGHSVVLFEKETSLGGQVRIASKEPHRGELLEIINYLEAEVRRLGVTIHLSQLANAKDLTGFDSIIIATGAVPASPRVSGNTTTKVISVFEALKGNDFSDFAGENAIVFDDGSGFWPALNVAERLATNGLHVTYVTQSSGIGASIPHESIQPLLKRLGAAGVNFMIFHQLAGVDDQVIKVRNILTRQESDFKADLVVIETGRVQENTLAKELNGLGIPMYSVGDSVSPRRINNAILEAHRIARTI
ncbi:FAD-dependent oxidoreductase [Neobacillus niacini]|uniref:oxidoreductase n=1 Tax=Neobacillus niacini TaxID=86668 RepID=UPI0021CB2C58|nr:FAD-dependent oxidoreductase [Neobacillus niacini]MCM3766178.1 FAD-dependent oxidoreductase [Neobacillus niacini]